MKNYQAMRQMNRMFKNFKYLYKRQDIDILEWHFTFFMDSKNHNLQMTLVFNEKWCDVLCFISPTIQIPLEKNYWETLKILNYINYYIKSWGRFYIDPYGDLAYSLRLDYNVLEKIPDECIQEIECAVDYYSDLFVLLLKTGQGKTLFDDTKQFIDDMWRPLIGK